MQVAPFAVGEGGVRVAYLGRRLFTTDPSASATERSIQKVMPGDIPSCADSGKFTLCDEVVIKVFKKELSKSSSPELSEAGEAARYFSEIDTQVTALKFALDFNENVAKSSETTRYKIKYLTAKVAKTPDGSTPFMFVEKKFPEGTEWIKYTNNAAFVRHPKSEAEKEPFELLTAFSHFTYDYSDGEFLVCDLQGVSLKDDRARDTLLLTDPAIHSRSIRFGSTNLDKAGVQLFFQVHQCNRFCRALNLRTPDI